MSDYGVSTRYYGPTDYRGSRIRVTLGGQRKFVAYDYAANDTHESAVREAMASWGYAVSSVSHVCATESDRGSVYLVSVA